MNPLTWQWQGVLKPETIFDRSKSRKVMLWLSLTGPLGLFYVLTPSGVAWSILISLIGSAAIAAMTGLPATAFIGWAITCIGVAIFGVTTVDRFNARLIALKASETDKILKGEL